MTRWHLVVNSAAMVAVAGLLAGRVEASAPSFLVNGNETLLVFDANRNGVIPDAGDCVVTGTNPSGSAFTLTLAQTVTGGAVPLQICHCNESELQTGGTAASSPATYMGEGAVSVGTATAGILDTCVDGLGTPRVSVDVAGTSHNQPTRPSAAGGVIEPALTARTGAIFNDGMVARENLGAGVLCRAVGGPAVAVTGRNGLQLLVSLQKVSSGYQDYECASVPIPRADTGAIEMIPACVPVDANDMSVLSLDGLNLVGIDFAMLPECAGERVPTTSEWTLIALALALTVGGALALRRRASFTAAMPQF